MEALVSHDRAARLQDHANLIWGAAEKLRGKITPADYGKIILPFTVLRRMDCLLEPHIQTIQALAAGLSSATDEARAQIISRKTGLAFYGLSDFTLSALLADPENVQDNLKAYINGLSRNMRDVFIEHFGFFNWIDRLERQNLLYALVKFFADKDLHPERVSTMEMGYLFENLIRRFNEASNATAGDHYTPREVIRLMTSLLFAKDGDKLAAEASAINILDPACGTGGMLATANDYLQERNANLRVNLFGQEVNPESFAICRSDMLLTGHSPDNIQIGNTLNDDQFPGQTYSYCLSNPPYGVDYGEEYDDVKAEHERGEAGRFEAGIPRKSDGQLLFLLHMISKLPKDRPGRIAVIMNGSPLFNGDAGGGESEIRRFLMEDDMVDAIIALPTDLFYNTGIATYVWIVTNRKPAEDRGKVRLIDASSRWSPMRKSLGSKRRELTDADIEQIANLYLGFDEDATVKVFAPEDFGYRKIFIDRPLRLDVDLGETEPGRFRNTSELDAYFLWMQQTFGEDCDQRLKAIKLDVTEHIEEEEGLALLRADENAAKAELAAASKRCKRLLKILLDPAEHAERRTLIDLIRGLRADPKHGGQTAWMDYNAFAKAMQKHAKTEGEKLTAARLKAIRAWVTATNPEAAPVIDKDVTGQQHADARFGFHPLGGKVITYERDSDLADTERVPLDQNITDYFEAEVLPHVADAWINPDKRDDRDGQIGLVGYEINFNRYFYEYVPPRPLAEIDAELKAVEKEIADLLAEVAE
ncbi:MAG: SAM-dependent DNA methyltransferase [Chromatiales bacterium]|nr:SAM-dependent DNA methyltransferase [Chromatiales bacterium]